MMKSMSGEIFISFFSLARRRVHAFVRWYTEYMNSPSAFRRGVSFTIFSGVLFLAVLGLLHIIERYTPKLWIDG